MNEWMNEFILDKLGNASLPSLINLLIIVSIYVKASGATLLNICVIMAPTQFCLHNKSFDL